MARTAVSAPWATVRPRKVYELTTERYANGMINKNESNGPGRDATNALASSAPNVTHVSYKSMRKHH